MLHTFIKTRSQATFKGSSKLNCKHGHQTHKTKRDNDSTSKPDSKYKQNKDRSTNIHKLQELNKVIPDTETRALSHSKEWRFLYLKIDKYQRR